MFLPTLTTLAALLSLSSTTSASPSHSLSARSPSKHNHNLAARAPTVCNGHAELCDRSYGNVTFIGTHNSYGNGSSIMDNQGKGVVDQLNDGVRTLQVQAHKGSAGDIRLCHSSCTLLDGGSLTSYLTKVKGWMDANPNEVVSLVIVNIDTIEPSTYASAFDAAGMTSNVYQPAGAVTAIDAWPTLGSMIENGGRMVVFMDHAADFNSVGWIIDEFSNMWEDAYDVTDQEFGCNVNRSSGSPTTTLSLTNHFLDVYGNILGINAWLPNKDLLNETNAETGYGSIGQGAQNCVGLWGRPPNHILLDFYDSNGNSPFNVAAQLNGVSAPTNTVEVSEDSKGSNAEASGVAKSTAAATGATSTGGTAARTTTSALNAAGRSIASVGSGAWVAGIVAMMVGAGGLSLSL